MSTTCQITTSRSTYPDLDMRKHNEMAKWQIERTGWGRPAYIQETFEVTSAQQAVMYLEMWCEEREVFVSDYTVRRSETPEELARRERSS